MAGCARAHEYLCNLWCIYFLQACPLLFFLLSIAMLPPSNTEMVSLFCLPQTCRRRASPRLFGAAASNHKKKADSATNPCSGDPARPVTSAPSPPPRRITGAKAHRKLGRRLRPGSPPGAAAQARARTLGSSSSRVRAQSIPRLRLCLI